MRVIFDGDQRLIPMSGMVFTPGRLEATRDILTPNRYDWESLTQLRLAYRQYVVTGDRTHVEHVWGDIVETWGEPLDGRLPIRADESFTKRHQAWLESFMQLHSFVLKFDEFPSREHSDIIASICGVEWITQQRRLSRTGKLRADRKLMLDTHLPGWDKTPVAVSWDETLDELVGFVETHGELPSARGRREGEYRLAKWLSTQRVTDRKTGLAEGREAKLNARIPEWRQGIRPVEKWETRMRLLADFVESHGRLPSKSGDSESERNLNTWLGNQRVANREGRLKPERLAELNKLQLDWTGRSRHDRNFECRAIQYAKHVADHGSHPVRRRGSATTEDSLSAWMGKQRTAYRNGTLTPERKAILDQRISGWLNPKSMATRVEGGEQ